jgi:arylformamidase
MLHATDWSELGMAPPPIAGAVTLSGVHDLMPMLQFSFNADFRLTAEEAQRLSPVLLRPTTAAPVLVAVGAEETSEFVRQSRLLWEAWPHNRPPGAKDMLAVPARHHFNVVLDYTDPDSELTRRTLALFG